MSSQTERWRQVKEQFLLCIIIYAMENTGSNSVLCVLVQTEKDCYPNVCEEAWEDNVLRESWENQAYDGDKGQQLDL